MLKLQLSQFIDLLQESFMKSFSANNTNDSFVANNGGHHEKSAFPIKARYKVSFSQLQHFVTL